MRAFSPRGLLPCAGWAYERRVYIVGTYASQNITRPPCFFLSVFFLWKVVVYVWVWLGWAACIDGDMYS